MLVGPLRKLHPPITLPILKRIRSFWNGTPMQAEYVISWAAVMLSFFKVLPLWADHCAMAGGIQGVNSPTHVGWGNTAFYNPTNQRAVWLHLCQSNTVFTLQ